MPTQAPISDSPFYDTFVLDSLFFRKFLMILLRVIYGLTLSPNQKSWLRLYVSSMLFFKL